MSHGPRGAVVLARVSSAPPTLCQAAFLLSFSPSPAVRTELLDLALHYASMEREREREKKIRPRNRPEIQCLHMVPSCPLFSNENVLYD